MKIILHSVIDSNSIDYLSFMWNTINFLSSKKNELELFVYNLDNVQHFLFENKKVKNILIQTNLKNGSELHSYALNVAIKSTNDGNIHILVDSDTVCLLKNWDEFIINKLNQVDMFGTAYEDIGGISSENSLVQTYKNIPNLIYLALSKNKDWTNLVLNSNLSKNLKITNENLSKIYNLPLNYFLLKDSGYNIPEYLYTNSLTYESLKLIKSNNTNSIVLKNQSNYHEEYHIIDDQNKNIPFLVHQRGSRKHKFRKSKLSIDFYNCIENYMLTNIS